MMKKAAALAIFLVLGVFAAAHAAKEFEEVWFNPKTMLFSREKDSPGPGYYRILFDNPNRQIVEVRDPRLTFPSGYVPDFDLTPAERAKVANIVNMDDAIGTFNEAAARIVAENRETDRQLQAAYERMRPQIERRLRQDLAEAKRLTAEAEKLLREGRLKEAASNLREAQFKFKDYVRHELWAGREISESVMAAIAKNQILTQAAIDAGEKRGGFITAYFERNLGVSPPELAAPASDIDPPGVLEAPVDISPADPQLPAVKSPVMPKPSGRLRINQQKRPRRLR